MVKLWFLSDPHFGHDRIIEYCSRPFANAAEMDEALVERWNALVRPQDHGYLLGDIAMRKPSLNIVQRLNGHKRLVGGNHDIYRTKDYLAAGFEEVRAMRVIDRILFAHIPIHPASMGRFRAQVHGHIHNNQSFTFPYINVSAEVINYTPISFEEIVAIVEDWKAKGYEGTTYKNPQCGLSHEGSCNVACGY